jgi:hypothetical protein
MAYLYCNIAAHRLGNALFMAASTIGIAFKNHMQPLFPADWKYRQYFNLPDKFFGECEITHGYYEAAFDYREVQIREDNNSALTGYFQSEKYWIDYKKDILKWLTPKGVKPGSKEAVSIHHRRGDYVNNPNYQQIGVNYHISAYDSLFKGKPIKPFSDSHHYIDLHYLGNTLAVQPTNEIDDFKAMIACKYHICSNSTFSWWAAYLSGGEVVRPTKYFDGNLSKQDEKDLWPDSWIAWDNNYKIDLYDTTFIIPFSFDHNDRLQNIQVVYQFLTKNFNTNIIIGEINTSKLTESVKYTMHRFHRTKVLNDLTRKAETPIVFNWDADVVCSPVQIYKAVEAIRNGADVCYPFTDEFANVPRGNIQPFIRTLDCGVFAGRLWPWQRPFKSVGGAFCYNKESFFKAGGENEAFISYGPEDQERYLRFNLLGLKVEKIPGTIFHMEHWRGNNSCERHPDAKQNIELWEAEKKMTAEEMRAYVNSELWGTSRIPKKEFI